jgi:hypothetical protein
VTKLLTDIEINEINKNPELKKDKDISLDYLSKHGFMVAPISIRNREFL